MANIPSSAFAGQAAQATSSMPMSQIDAQRAGTGYTNSIPRAMPTLPAQANQRAVAAVSKQVQPRLTNPQPVSQPPVNVQATPMQAQQMGRGLIGRPMAGGMPAPQVMPTQYPVA